MQTETNHELATRGFPRFGQQACSYFEFSLALYEISLRSDWPVVIT